MLQRTWLRSLLLLPLGPMSVSLSIILCGVWSIRISSFVDASMGFAMGWNNGCGGCCACCWWVIGKTVYCAFGKRHDAWFVTLLSLLCPPDAVLFAASGSFSAVIFLKTDVGVNASVGVGEAICWFWLINLFWIGDALRFDWGWCSLFPSAFGYRIRTESIKFRIETTNARRNIEWNAFEQ